MWAPILYINTQCLLDFRIETNFIYLQPVLLTDLVTAVYLCVNGDIDDLVVGDCDAEVVDVMFGLTALATIETVIILHVCLGSIVDEASYI